MNVCEGRGNASASARAWSAHPTGWKDFGENILQCSAYSIYPSMLWDPVCHEHPKHKGIGQQPNAQTVESQTRL